ncbi:MAG: FHA domain-containing protein [Deltaproteobacteria bacterium]|nr:FHA domain-containing protein [Deltaproteobacteria bacterium]
MRECLGWTTNCERDQTCPQNWLELSVAECPRSIGCHVCGRTVELVLTEAEFQERAHEGTLSAWPVVPCVGVPGRERAAVSGADGAHAAPVFATPAPMIARHWVVQLQGGEVIALDKDTMIVGRSRTCDVVIPSAKVSRQHASLTRVDGEWYIEDLGSANGVWLNGEKVAKSKIREGDVYTISDETLAFAAR